MKILIFGAGSTGCFIGAHCINAGFDTTFLCRPRIKSAIEDAKQISMSDYQGTTFTTPPPNLITELEDARFDLCFVTLKCHQLATASAQLKQLSEQGCELHFLQNGLGSFEEISASLNLKSSFSGIVPFNVVSLENASFHQGTEGILQLQETANTLSLQKAFRKVDYDCSLEVDMGPIIHGKLLLNLNNALNAIADIPLKQELENAQYRRVIAAAMDEWLAICARMQQSLKTDSPIAAKHIPKVLRLPTWLFKLVARRMLTIDPIARSSMWEDIQANRKTEISYLNGAVVELGAELNIDCPVNAEIATQIRALEAGKEADFNAIYRLC
jgi:2-dehydropantoate 2-reductase